MRFIESIERVEEFLLRAFFARQELNVVDHQHVDMTIPLPQIHHFVVSNGVDDLVRKLLGRQIGNPEIGSLRHIISNGIQEVRLPQPGLPVNKEWVIGFRRLFSDRHTGGVGKLISRSYYEILESILGVELYPSFRPRSDVLATGGSGTPTILRLLCRLFMKDDERDGCFFPTSGSRDGFSQEGSVVLAQPVTKELIWDTQLSRRVLNPFEVNRCKPRIINLFWHFPLDVSQGVLPFICDSHDPCIILHTQAYSHLLITCFFVRPSVLNLTDYQTLKELCH